MPPWTLPSLPAPRVTPLPLAVGVHYAEGFEHQKHLDDSKYHRAWHHPGAASVKLFESALAATFERVVRVSRLPPAAPSDLALIVVPTVAGVWSGSDGMVELVRSYGIHYEIALLDSDGRQLDQWDLHASSGRAVFSTYDAQTAVVLRAAMTELLFSLRERPEVRMRIEARERASVAEAPKMAPSSINGFAILGSSDWVDCMKLPLGNENFTVLDMGVEQFRDAMFPWFEPLTQPTTSEDWTRLLSEPKARAAAAELGIRYVLIAHGTTRNDMQSAGACGTYGCFEVATGTRHTSLNVALADFARGDLVAETSVSEAGSAHAAILGIVPLWASSPTETRACQKAAAEIGRLLKGR